MDSPNRVESAVTAIIAESNPDHLSTFEVTKSPDIRTHVSRFRQPSKDIPPPSKPESTLESMRYKTHLDAIKLYSKHASPKSKQSMINKSTSPPFRMSQN